MKATVQYNDFIGTSAADISDHTKLNDFLASRGVDTDKYEAIGASFYANYSKSFTASIICIDKEQSSESKKHIAKISFEASFDKDEFFDLFKRFDVILAKKHNGYQENEIDEEIIIDDRPAQK